MKSNLPNHVISSLFASVSAASRSLTHFYLGTEIVMIPVDLESQIQSLERATARERMQEAVRRVVSKTLNHSSSVSPNTVLTEITKLSAFFKIQNIAVILTVNSRDGSAKSTIKAAVATGLQ